MTNIDWAEALTTHSTSVWRKRRTQERTRATIKTIILIAAVIAFFALIGRVI